jgi:hypothetical protein
MQKKSNNFPKEGASNIQQPPLVKSPFTLGHVLITSSHVLENLGERSKELSGRRKNVVETDQDVVRSSWS